MNYNTQTKVPYGTINGHDLDQDVLDELLINGHDEDYNDALNDYATSEGWLSEDEYEGINHQDVDEWLESNNKVNAFHESYEQTSWVGMHENTAYQIQTFAGAHLVFIVKSDYYQEFQRCSPCVPGAHDIQPLEPISQTRPENAGYCCPPSWLIQEYPYE